MKQTDTTDDSAYEGTRILMSGGGMERESQLADQFRIHLAGMYFSEIGPRWSSAGKFQSDYQHHIDIGISGNRQVVHEGRVHDLGPGQVWFLPGNTPVERRCAERCEVVFFRVRCECLPGVDPLLDWPGREPRLAGTCHPGEWRQWLKPERAFGVMDLLKMRVKLLGWTCEAIPELAEVVSRHLDMTAQFTRVFDVVERELGADLRLRQLADAYGTTTDAFSMAFSRSTGISPKEYMTRRLNQQALHWVVNTDHRMKDVAAKLRFTDEFYFSRFFKKLNGSSPKAYRRKFRRNPEP